MTEQVSRMTELQRSQTIPLWLRLGFWVCIVISIAAVTRRVLALAYPPHSAPPQLAALDETFASHAELTLAHVLPALAFVVISPIYVFRRFVETSWPKYLLFLLGVVVGVTAYGMTGFSIGGWIERSAVLLFNTLFLFSLFQAYRHMRSHELLLERRWMIRAIGILLGIATTRPVMGVFFATSRLTHLEPREFFGMAFWIGFSINALVVECWLRAKDRRSRAGVAAV